MQKPNRLMAFLAYFLTIFGWLLVLLFYRQNKFAVFHARQSLTITLAAIGAPLVWLIGGWLITLIPYMFIFVVALYTLVISLYFILLFDWVLGMIYALQAKQKNLPIIGNWAKRLPIH